MNPKISGSDRVNPVALKDRAAELIALFFRETKEPNFILISLWVHTTYTNDVLDFFVTPVPGSTMNVFWSEVW